MEKGTFVIDKFSGYNTQFSIFFPRSKESFIKAVSVRDSNSNTFSTVMDTTQNLHYYSLFSVPFDSEAAIGQSWSYRLERLANYELKNEHVIQVTSSAQQDQSQINIDLATNKNGYEVEVRPDQPLVLYASVMQESGTPVINAKVEALIKGINTAGFPMPDIKVDLYDSGTGDPDMFQNDGVYSRYIIDILEEGRYTVQVRVSANENSLEQFTRVEQGFSLRVTSLQRGTKDSFPPSRILDLEGHRVHNSGEVKFSWTAPGDDYDSGKPTSYQIHSSTDPSTFYKPTGSSQQLVDRFNASNSVASGAIETHNINLTSLFDKSLYFTILAVDDEGNVGYYSNIVKIYFPPRAAVGQQFGGAGGSEDSSDGSNPKRQGLYDPLRGIWPEPNSIIWYAVIGVVTVVIFTLILVSISIIVSRRKRSSADSVTTENDARDDGSAGFKNNELLRFSSINLTLESAQKNGNHVDSPSNQYRSPNSRINPYTELVIDTDYSSSQDRLFYSSENLYNQLRSSTAKSNMASRSTDNMLLHSNANASTMGENDSAMSHYLQDSSMFTATAIYAKPLPKCERKSILKKPREQGDGESDPTYSSSDNPSSELSELSESPISYLETDLDLNGSCNNAALTSTFSSQHMAAAVRRGPPTMPKPVLSSENLENQFTPVLAGSNLCSPNGSESCTENYGTLTPSARRIRNVTQV